MIRRTLTALVIAVLAAGLLAPAASAQERNQEDSQAVAVNTEDGASVFRLALSVRRVHDGVVDQTNTAVALASCTDCQTVALAFQVVLVSGDVDVVTPENRAVALNVECSECLTYASATQLVLGADRNVHLTGEGYQRLAALYKELRELEGQLPELEAADLHARVTAAEQELTAIFTEELVEAGAPERAPAPDEEEDDPTAATTTTSTTEPEPTASSTTTTTEAPTTTSTTVVSTTTTTEASGA